MDPTSKEDRCPHLDGWARSFLANIFIKGMWRPLKYECIYSHAFSSSGREDRQGIGTWMTFYNRRRPHAAHGGETSVGIYRERLSASGPGLTPGPPADSPGGVTSEI
jgi:putative transposase